MSQEDKIIPLTNKADVKCEGKTISADVPL